MHREKVRIVCLSAEMFTPGSSEPNLPTQSEHPSEIDVRGSQKRGSHSCDGARNSAAVEHIENVGNGLNLHPLSESENLRDSQVEQILPGVTVRAWGRHQHGLRHLRQTRHDGLSDVIRARLRETRILAQRT